MDAKYLAEIKARGEAAAVHEYDGITDLIYGRDVKALVAEAERLTEENAALQAANDKMVVQNRRIISRELDKDQQIATLKSEVRAALEAANMWTDAEGKRREENDTLRKALELMAMDLYDCHTANNVAIENAVANYIQQAQEQERKK